MRETEKNTWSGKFRAPLNDLGNYLRPVQDRIPIWIAVGGTPGSVIRAASMGLPLALAIIGGTPERFAPLFELFRRASKEADFDPEQIPLSLNSHGFIAEDSQEAVEAYYPAATKMMNKIGRERGWPPTTRQQLEQQRFLHGSDFVGTPDEIIE